MESKILVRPAAELTDGPTAIAQAPAVHSVKMPAKVRCETCGKPYASKKSLKIHLRTHTGYKPYACHLCPKRFTQTNVLKAHVSSHLGRRDWHCRFCKKAFTQSAHLRTHEKIHMQVKDYVCTYCRQSFGSKGVRDRHMRQHTGEKPYKCSTCSKTFTRGESLRFHENAHQGIRPFRCTVAACGSSFTKQSSLKRHISHCHETDRPLPPKVDAKMKISKLCEVEASQNPSPVGAVGSVGNSNFTESSVGPQLYHMGINAENQHMDHTVAAQNFGLVMPQDGKYKDCWTIGTGELDPIIALNPFDEFDHFNGWMGVWENRLGQHQF